ncbi:MAG: 2-oxoacid:acceptor oxidoreductase family protein [Candidatus Methanofastidiosia archaeon]
MWKFRFAGNGGQGIISMGILFAKAASKSYNTLQTQSYGAEARLGACKSEVLISKEPIYELEISQVDFLCCLSSEALKKYKNDLSDEGLILKDSLIEGEGASIPAIEISLKEFGDVIFANSIMLSFLTSYVNLFPLKDLEEIFRDSFEGETLKKNLKALRLSKHFQ